MGSSNSIVCLEFSSEYLVNVRLRIIWGLWEEEVRNCLTDMGGKRRVATDPDLQPHEKSDG